MHHPIYPCIWFDGQAREAFDLYARIFPGTRILADTPLVVTCELEGQRFMGLNGGPRHRPNPSISFYTSFDTEAEVRQAWALLADGARVLIPLDHHPWNACYGWLQDRYGVSWQLLLHEPVETGERLVPALMFTQPYAGKASEAVQFYTSLFPETATHLMVPYEAGDGDVPGYIKHGRFQIGAQVLVVLDSSLEHGFTFNEGLSLVVECDTQAEIDHYWNAFADGGSESMCGWVRDRFGVWWQVIPAALSSMMSDPARAGRVMEAFLKMQKFDLATLQRAYDGH